MLCWPALQEFVNSTIDFCSTCKYVVPEFFFGQGTLIFDRGGSLKTYLGMVQVLRKQEGGLRREAAKIFCLRCAYVEFFKGVKYFFKSPEAQKRIETTQETSLIVIAHSL